MLLGASGEKYGYTVDLDVVMDSNRSGDAGVPNGVELLGFASAANQRSDELSDARESLRAVVGEALRAVAGNEGVLEAAATVAAGSASSTDASTAARRSSDNEVLALFD
jgi:hypothetical protein